MLCWVGIGRIDTCGNCLQFVLYVHVSDVTVAFWSRAKLFIIRRKSNTRSVPYAHSLHLARLAPARRPIPITVITPPVLPSFPSARPAFPCIPHTPPTVHVNRFPAPPGRPHCPSLHSRGCAFAKCLPFQVARVLHYVPLVPGPRPPFRPARCDGWSLRTANRHCHHFACCHCFG